MERLKLALLTLLSLKWGLRLQRDSQMSWRMLKTQKVSCYQPVSILSLFAHILLSEHRRSQTFYLYMYTVFAFPFQHIWSSAFVLRFWQSNRSCLSSKHSTRSWKRWRSGSRRIRELHRPSRSKPHILNLLSPIVDRWHLKYWLFKLYLPSFVGFLFQSLISCPVRNHLVRIIQPVAGMFVLI